MIELNKKAILRVHVKSCVGKMDGRPKFRYRTVKVKIAWQNFPF